jgi:hypothetical protein
MRRQAFLQAGPSLAARRHRRVTWVADTAVGAKTDPAHGEDPSRRDFIYIAAIAVAAGGAAALAWPFIDQMNPAADTLALASIEFDLSKVAAGQQVVVKWRGKPLFVRNRTPAEIAKAVADDGASMKDPAEGRRPGQAGQGPVADRRRQLHPPGLRPDLRRRRVRRLVLPLPRLGLRHLGSYP